MAQHRVLPNGVEHVLTDLRMAGMVPPAQQGLRVPDHL